MANETVKEFTQYVGPDSLRKTTQLLKNVYDMYTKRFCGYTDINGCQYNGTVENFGSEMLFESRKMLMDKPPLGNIFIENSFDFYFDIQYADEINTYDQQNMLCGIIRKDVFLPDKKYNILFENVEVVNIPRSQSWSDPIVYNDPYVKTTTPPTLLIDSGNGNIEHYSLKLSDKSSVETTYYFRLDNDMRFDRIGRIESIIKDGYMYTGLINDSMHGRPFIWMTVNSLSYLPNIGFMNNVFKNRQLFTIGTNGHDFSLVYPFMNYTKQDDGEYWLIKVIPDEDDDFIENDRTDTNYYCRINEIHLLRYDEDDINIQNEPLEDICIRYNNKSYTKMTLSRFKSIGNGGLDPYFGKWTFRRPKQGDYDYDGKTYVNLCYAYTSFNSFMNNFNSLTEPFVQMQMVECFRVYFDDDYVHQNEIACMNVAVGVHIDVTSDHSDNGVSKKNGVINNLGDYDGLPSYFKYMLDDDIHRAHVELYNIKDGVNNPTKAMDKQTAGIIIDSGIPQNEIKKITSDMPIVIKYDFDDTVGITYKTIGDVVSPKNCLSEIVYVDENTFANVNTPKYSMMNKFVYHGNRVFSLGISDLDPDLEYGRVYMISNDDAVYENNATTKNTKPERTMARICDIPTKFAQLTNIKNLAPTLIIDKDYVRTEASFTTEDKNILYNLTNTEHFFAYREMGVILPWWYDPNKIPTELIEEQYSKYVHLNESIDISSLDVTYDIHESGSDYNVNDEFSFYVGGICIRGIVKELDGSSVKRVVYYHVDDNNNKVVAERPVFNGVTNINRATLGTRESLYAVENLTSTGSGLVIKITVSESVWNNTEMTTVGCLDDIFLCKLDYFGNVWIWTYDGNKWNQETQLSGLKVYDNIYDDEDTRDIRSIGDCLINTMINPIINTMDSYGVEDNIDVIDIDGDVTGDTDYSNNIEILKMDKQDSYYVLIDDVNDEQTGIVTIQNNVIKHSSNDITLPVNHDVNLDKYTPKTNKLIAFNNNDKQPTLYVYNPFIDVKYTNSVVDRDTMIRTNPQDITVVDLFKNTEYQGRFINQQGVVQNNIYMYNEYDTTFIDELKESLNKMTRSELISYIRNHFPHATLLLYENTLYHYNEQMLINYILTSTIYRDRDTVDYNGDKPSETIYRRPSVSLMCKRGDSIYDKGWNPIGKQPTGDFESVTTEMFDPVVKTNTGMAKCNPLYVFRIDNDEITSLNDYRIYDDMDNDISAYSLLILNRTMYRAIVDKTNKTIKWIKVNRQEGI